MNWVFDWDVWKAVTNIDKHGISFEVAATVFWDDNAYEGKDLPHSSQEPRLFRVGTASDGRVLIVIYTVRRFLNGEEKIRIISARQASRKERKVYSG